MNIKIIGIFIAIIIFLGFSIFPAMQGIENIRIIKRENDIQLDKNNFDIVEFLDKMENQDDATDEDAFYEIQNYLNDKDIDPSLLIFNYLCNRIKNNMGEKEYNNFISFFEKMLQYLNSNDITIMELYSLFSNDIKLILTDLSYVLDGFKSENDFFDKIEDLLEIYKTEKTNFGDSEFDVYWDKYTRAKCYWAGYLPQKSEDEDEKGSPNIDSNVNKGLIKLWIGDNFRQWSDRAATYIIGVEEDTGTAPFWLLNQALFIVVAILAVTSVPIFIHGFLTESNVKLVLGGGLALIGLFAFSLMMYYDWITFVYFLFGTNGYLECHRFGNVEFMVHVIDENGSDVKTSCIVTAKSKNAFDIFDQNNPPYPGFEVNWTIDEEFEYQMEKVTNDNGNYSIFSLQSSQKSPEKWERAVPPPGMWTFTVSATGYQPTVYHTKEPIKPGECFNITIPLEKL